MAAFFAPLTDSPKPTLSATDRCGNSAGVWNTKPMFRAARRQARDVLVVEQIRPRGRLDEPGDHPQRRRLAAAGRAEQGHELAVGDVEVELVDGDGLAVVLA